MSARALLLATTIASAGACSSAAHTPTDGGSHDGASDAADGAADVRGEIDAADRDTRPPWDAAPRDVPAPIDGPAPRCLAAEPGTLVTASTTPASPYLVRHPIPANPACETVIFVPGGSGSRRGAERIWEMLSRDRRVDGYRVVVPYSDTVDFIDDAGRALDILDEVLDCYGGDASRVHVAGHSFGGLVAFGLMGVRPERFATLLGAPGLFPTAWDPPAWAAALGDRPVFNGAGELDDGWKIDVQRTHEALVAEGADAVYVEFPGEEHRWSDAFDVGVFFDFWGRP